MIYADGSLFLAAAGGVVFPSFSRGWAAGGTVPAVVTAENAASTAAAATAAMRATVATSPRVAGAAAHGTSAADVLADGGHDHRCDALLSACPADLIHGLHLQSRFGRHPHGRRLTRGTGAPALIRPEFLHASQPLFRFFQIEITFHRIHARLVRETWGKAFQYYSLDFPCGRYYIMPLKVYENDFYARKIIGHRLVRPYIQGLEFSFCSIVRIIFRLVRYFFTCTPCLRGETYL